MQESALGMALSHEHGKTSSALDSRAAVAEKDAVPVVTVVVPTRNRPDSMLRAALSVLRGDEPATELVIVDQSDGDETSDALSALSDPRIRLIRTGPIGKAAAVNLGVQAASAEFIAMTDDDCEVAPGFAREGARLLSENPRAALVCFSVFGVPCDPELGWVEGREFLHDAEFHGLRNGRTASGLGAALVVRRGDCLAMGGFDELLGPGSRYPAAEENDFAIRVLRSGRTVIHSNRSHVVHHGFRTHAEGRTLARRNYTGIGAVVGKHMKTGSPLLSARILTHHTAASIRKAVPALVRTGRPSGAAEVLHLWLGLFHGLRHPVDRRTLLFRHDR